MGAVCQILNSDQNYDGRSVEICVRCSQMFANDGTSTNICQSCVIVTIQSAINRRSNPRRQTITDEDIQLPEMFAMFSQLSEQLIRKANESMEKQITPAIRCQLMKCCVDDGLLNRSPTCSLCLESFDEGKSVVKLPCSHHFHDDCVMLWFRKSLSCPLCRYALDEKVPSVENILKYGRDEIVKKLLELNIHPCDSFDSTSTDELARKLHNEITIRQANDIAASDNDASSDSDTFL